MIYSLLVLSGPACGHTNLTASTFALAVLEAGHSIHRVFFLDGGASSGNACAVPPQDETNPLGAWRSLHETHGVELVLCVSSALRQGMLDEREAERHERPAATIDPAFVISGLGQLVDAGIHSDRLVTFGG